MTDNDLAKTIYGDNSKVPDDFGLRGLLTSEQRAELDGQTESPDTAVTLELSEAEARHLRWVMFEAMQCDIWPTVGTEAWATETGLNNVVAEKLRIAMRAVNK